jgi:hypothetical protein
MISSNAEFCPHCGERYLVTCKVLIHRNSAFVAAMLGMDIIIDGVFVKSLGNNESIALELAPGNHILTAGTSVGWNKHESAQLPVLPSKEYTVELRYTMFGVDIQRKEVEN